MKKCLAFFCFIFFFLSSPVYADYILPYPSYMPGNRLYQISRILDVFSQWWYWGNIASVKYRLKLADKYIVEAKTLFEYHQYQLGVEALKRSDMQVSQIVKYLVLAKQENKDIKKMDSTIVDGMNAHITILEKLSKELPETFTWTPEKQESTLLNFSQLFQNAKMERMKLLK